MLDTTQVPHPEVGKSAADPCKCIVSKSSDIECYIFYEVSWFGLPIIYKSGVIGVDQGGGYLYFWKNEDLGF